MRILIVDDETAVRSALRRALILDGYEIDEASDGQEALDHLRTQSVDLIVLDIQMPKVDGLEVCRRLRKADDHTPILMLTARETVPDRVAGLDAGADDYLIKPFDLDELLARVRALMRRKLPEQSDSNSIGFGPIKLDLAMYQAQINGRSIELTRTEFQLLELFLRNPRQILERHLINERVWGYDFGPNSNSLGVYIGYLRRKLEENGEPRLIHTVRGVGYILRQEK